MSGFLVFPLRVGTGFVGCFGPSLAEGGRDVGVEPDVEGLTVLLVVPGFPLDPGLAGFLVVSANLTFSLYVFLRFMGGDGE